MNNYEFYKENFIKLADFLEANVNDKEFDMLYFRAELKARDNKKITVARAFMDKNDCGTIGCALGWAPLVPGLEPIINDRIDDRHTLSKELNISQYSARVFGSVIEGYWDYVFDSKWVLFDNSRKGAILRIRSLVKNDLKVNKELYNYERYKIMMDENGYTEAY